MSPFRQTASKIGSLAKETRPRAATLTQEAFQAAVHAFRNLVRDNVSEQDEQEAAGLAVDVIIECMSQGYVLTVHTEYYKSCTDVV